MNLKKWLKNKKIIAKQFAENIGTSEATVSRWLSGKRKPSGKFLSLIEKITMKEVTAIDFHK